MEAEKQLKEPISRISHSRSGGGNMSFVDNRLQVASQAKLIDSIQRRENRTGLPDNLKTGIENLSGFSMDDVRVHYNSDKPAQLQALAYTQGADIHVGPGQEKYLSHEAWHVVQQKQGRVNPTIQLKGMEISDDQYLEEEANVMGEKALEMTAATEVNSIKQNKLISSRPIQRRVGFEFQTNLLLRDQKDHSPTLRRPLFERPLWHIECDQGELEFITEPFSDYPEMQEAMSQIVNWARALGDLRSYVPEQKLEEADFFLLSEYSDEQQIGAEMITDNQTRDLKDMKVCKSTLLENLFVVGNVQDITAAPQTTIGIPLDKIISSLHLIASKSITLNQGGPNSETVKFGSNQEEIPTLIPTHTSTVILVNKLRTKNPSIEEADWRKLEGLVGLVVSYIKSANSSRNSYSYIKMMAPLMSRVNFSAIYKAIPNSVQHFFTPELVAKASDLYVDSLVFGAKKAIKDIDGPTIEQWIDSIINGFDALSTLGIGHEMDTERIIEGSESMGQYNELDIEDEKFNISLVPIELRQISKNVPLDQWLELATEIMVFSNALLKSKFY